MSEQSTNLNEEQSHGERRRVGRTYLSQVMHDTFKRYGARIGLFWVIMIFIFAVFAPFLASSHPILMKSADGELSSPLLKHLYASDVFLPVLVILGVVFYFMRRVKPGLRLLMFSLSSLIVIVASFIWVRPPLVVVYDQYRVMSSESESAWVVNAPIPYSPTDRLRDQPELVHPMSPGSAHWMGTERNGADVLSQMIHACRIAISIGFIATGISMVIGIMLGGLMGYFSGVVDLLGMRLVEIFSAIPVMYLLLTFAAFFPGNPSLAELIPGHPELLKPIVVSRIYLMMVIIGITGWVGYARFIRAEFLKLRAQDFVQAARACGLPIHSILFRHMLPNGVAPVLVNASFGIASAILLESFLSFLGLGLVDQASWGQLLSQALGAGGGFSWWIATFPGAAIFLTVFAFNLIGEAMRDAIDPHLKQSPG